MRIAYVITDLETGGVPLHLAGLASHAAQGGCQIYVTCLSPRGPVSDLLELRGVETNACDAAGWWDVRAIVRLGRLLDRFQPDIVHSMLFHANIASRIACAFNGYPASRLICEIQTVEIERRWHLTVDRFTQRMCGSMVGNSRSVVQHLERAARIAPSRLRLIEGGVDVDLIASAKPIPRSEFGCRDGVPLVMWVGRLDPIKGLDVLLEAVARIRRDQPVQLALVGDGPLRESQCALAHRLGLNDGVHWLGMRSDVPSLLKSADIFAFPSRTEGLPNALLEAMAAGLPIVTTNAPGCRDLITDGVTGLLVPVDDVSALAAAIQRLLSNSSLRAELTANASEKVAQRYRREACYERYLALYHEMSPG